MLKKCQERVVKEVEAYLRQLAQEDGDFAPSIAWMKLAAQLRLSPNYQRRVNGLGKDGVRRLMCAGKGGKYCGLW